MYPSNCESRASRSPKNGRVGKGLSALKKMTDTARLNKRGLLGIALNRLEAYKKKLT